MQDATPSPLRVCVVALAVGVVLLLIFRAAFVLDTNWDTIAYHMPFAARLAGLCDRTCFEMVDLLEVRYRSFPIVIEFLQGLLWRLTGRPQSVNFVALGFLFALVGYLRAAWAVPWHWSVLALCGVPMVQAAATSGYIDLATNCLATICLLTLFSLLVRPSAIRLWEVVVFVLCVVLLGNAKTQMMPVAGLLGFVFIALMSRQPAAVGFRGFSFLSGRGLAAALLLLVAISATGIRNLFEFQNPVYPVGVIASGYTLLAGPEMAASGSVSTALEHVPPPVRWVMSVLELSALDGRTTPYTIDQYSASQDLRSFRMGGYFGAYVILCLGFTAFALRRLPPVTSTRLAIAVTAVTVVVAFLPAAHELRYYMFWMLGLVALNLILYLSPVVSEFNDRGSLARAFQLVVLAAFLSVTSWTSARYLLPKPGLAAMLTKIQAQVDMVASGDIVCVPAINRSFLYASVFQTADRTYKVTQEDDPSCNRRF